MVGKVTQASEEYPLISQALQAGVVIEQIGHFWGDGDFNYDLHIAEKYVRVNTRGKHKRLRRELEAAMLCGDLHWVENGTVQCEDEETKDYCEPDLRLTEFVK